MSDGLWLPLGYSTLVTMSIALLARRYWLSCFADALLWDVLSCSVHVHQIGDCFWVTYSENSAEALLHSGHFGEKVLKSILSIFGACRIFLHNKTLGPENISKRLCRQRSTSKDGKLHFPTGPWHFQKCERKANPESHSTIVPEIISEIMSVSQLAKQYSGSLRRDVVQSTSPTTIMSSQRSPLCFLIYIWWVTLSTTTLFPFYLLFVMNGPELAGRRNHRSPPNNQLLTHSN